MKLYPYTIAAVFNPTSTKSLALNEDGATITDQHGDSNWALEPKIVLACSSDDAHNQLVRAIPEKFSGAKNAPNVDFYVRAL